MYATSLDHAAPATAGRRPGISQISVPSSIRLMIGNT